MSVSELPEKHSKLTHYKVVPAVLIGPLALDKSLQGIGYRRFLLVDALRRIAQSKDFAIMIVVVDPNERMYLPYKSIKKFI